MYSSLTFTFSCSYSFTAILYRGYNQSDESEVIKLALSSRHLIHLVTMFTSASFHQRYFPYIIEAKSSFLNTQLLNFVLLNSITGAYWPIALCFLPYVLWELKIDLPFLFKTKKLEQVPWLFVLGCSKQPLSPTAPADSFCSAQGPWGLSSSERPSLQWMWLSLSHL